MNFLNEIISTEKEADDIISLAKAKAQGILQGALKEQEEEYLRFEEALKKDRSDRLTAQARELQSKTESLSGEAKKIIQQIEAGSKERKKEAVKIILNSF
jgi:vacuolar-type H+-ATPase subunit H